MPVPGGTQSLTLGVTLTVAPPQPITPSADQSWMVELDNLSPWTLAVNISGQQYSLAPGMAQMYTARSGPALVTVTPTGPAPDTGTYTIVSNWAVSPDSIPGTFPVVVAPSLAGGNPNPNGNVVVAEPIVSGGSVNVPIPAGYTAVLIGLVNTGGVVAATVNWGQPSIPVDSLVFAKNNTLTGYTVGVLPVLGNTLTVSILGPGSAFLTVYGLVAPQLPPSQTVIDEQSQSLGSMAQNEYYPAVYGPGRYRIWANSSQSSLVAVQRWNGSAWHYIDQQAVGNTAANLANDDYEFVAPWDDWRVQVSNLTSTPATIFLAVTGPF